MTATDTVWALVRRLRRARQRQILAEHAWTGLCGGLLLASGAVLAVRAWGSPYASLEIAGWVLFGSLAVSLAVALWRRPDELEVAILADLRLNLKQRLSTALEFLRRGDDPTLAESLSGQLLRTRLPAKPERVFAMRVPIWGTVTPLAATLLVLVSLIDLPGGAGPAGAGADPAVVAEGERLSEFARQMARRAQREELPRALAESRSIQRLANRMARAALPRPEALSRLQQLSTGLGEAGRGIDGASTAAGDGVVDDNAVAARSTLQELLEGLMQGRVAPGAVREFGAATDPRSLGIAREDLERALQSLADGDDADLREVLEELARAERSRRDARELAEAREQLRRTRDNLGDSSAFAERPALRSPARPEPGGAVDGSPGERVQESESGSGALGALAGAGHEAGAPPPRPAAERTRAEGGVLRPTAQFREGESFTTGTRVVPGRGQVTLPVVELDARYAAQLEAVLAKEDYPAHYKELVRQYFLLLSAGSQPAARERTP